MKPLTLKIALIVFFGIALMNAYGQVNKTKIKKNAKTPTDTVARHQLDSLIKSGKAKDVKLDSLKKSTAAASAKADAANDMAKTASAKVAKAAKMSSPDTSGISKYIGKTYVINQNIRVTECNADGEAVKHPTRPIAIRGTRFLITADSANRVVILFNIWSLDTAAIKKYYPIVHKMFEKKSTNSSSLTDAGQQSEFLSNQRQILLLTEDVAKRKTFNFKQNWDQFAPNTTNPDSLDNNRYYFSITLDSLKKYCSEYKRLKDWDITFGTLSTPFKLRLNKFAFNSNVSIGGSIAYQKKLDSVWTDGFVLGLSLSSVTLDAASTFVYPDGTTSTAGLKSTPVTTSTTRPAFTPSISYLLSYKTINFTFGVGFDFISKPTDIATATNPEAGWIYNGKPWIGIGLGISLFNSNNSKSTTTPALAGQDDSSPTGKTK